MSENTVRSPQSILEQTATVLAALLLLYLLIVAVSTVGAGFRLATGDRARELFAFATNPFLGLVVGILSTALLQSSATVISIVVALVAGGLPVVTAIPVVMGSNLGTTITNTLVSLGEINQSQGFRRAFAAATVHDVFNLLAVTIFLPLELTTHILERTAKFCAGALVGETSLSLDRFDWLSWLTSPLVKVLRGLVSGFAEPTNGIVLAVLGVALLFGAIQGLSQVLQRLMVGRASAILHGAIGGGSGLGIASGAIVTALVQSSSTTTSLIVPLAGTGKFTLEEVYPFVLGANIGSCVTALLAATAITGTMAFSALEIAIVHLLYNVLAVLAIFFTPGLSGLPLRGARGLANLASDRPFIAVLYVSIVFFGIPGGLLGLSAWL